MNKLNVILRYWETIYHLINKEGMRVIYINDDGEEVWIEDDRKEPYQVIRIAQKDFDWARDLKSDLVQTYERSKLLKKRLGLRSANFVNLIITQFEPVDSYDHIVDQALPLTAGGIQQQRTILIPYDQLDQMLFPLATEWGLNEMPTYISLDDIHDVEPSIQSLKYSVQQASENRNEQEKKLFFYGRPFVTYMLLPIILAIFIFIELKASTTSIESLIHYGAKFNPLIHEGEWWRFFTAMFLHIGIFHLLMNSLALFYLGGAVERIFGSLRFLMIYFLAGFIGSVASFVFNEQVSAGASGAIFGCFGALLYFGLIHRRLFFRTMGMNVIVILIINLAFGFMVPMIDNGAHIGGLVGGFAASAIVGLPSQKGLKIKISSLFIVFVSVCFLLYYGYSKELTSQSYIIYFQIGEEQVHNEQIQEAKQYFEKILKVDEQLTEPVLTEAYFYMAYIQAHENKLNEAEENLLITVERDPKFHQAHYNLALIYYEQGRYRDALNQLQEALRIEPGNSSYESLKEELNRLIN
ncbi:rhomboid family intramembrane serine protease [Evansella sp. AB-P1]|uniref:rhomboid family intramembrane serine protease n=1 Tax=Evansella sp. AB-P1 TaxID=3037653 RepID=UPI00241D6426|nr:rhomboid family intramembrane serine protease [Evansella sp. AB-P1]MDG5788743.1 rhomboid family intramembrane serine protease [Evansella sp. AB-P1]